MGKSFTYMLLAVAVLLIAGCSRDEPGAPSGRRVEVAVALTGEQLALSKAFGDTHTVDRLLLVPLLKIDAAGAETPDNFMPVLEFAKQVDVASFDVNTSVMLTEGEAYRVLAIGFNQTDYNHEAPFADGTRFRVGASPATLEDLLLTLTYAPSFPYVPEFFSCFCTYSGVETFTATSGMNLSGDLVRIVGGLSMQITGITDEVNSMALRAEQLTTSISPVDGAPAGTSADSILLWQQDAPYAGGNVSLDVFMLSNIGAATKLYLYVYIGSVTAPVRYEVKVNDSAVSSANAITFNANDIVSISGDYSTIDAGFIMDNGSLDLDDDSWDGHTP